jgi:transcriptional regulator with XRE-family HTH domain
MQIRNARGWSQEQFAASCQLAGWDVSRGVIARIEGGVRWVADLEVLELAVPELYPSNKRRAFVKPPPLKTRTTTDWAD